MEKFVDSCHIAIILCLIILACSTQHGIATEIYSVKYNEPLPEGIENEIVVFENGPNGQKSKAHQKWLKLAKQREHYLSVTPKLANAQIACLSHEPIPGLPGHSIWTFRVSGLTSNKSDKLLSLSFEKPPTSLALPISLAGRDKSICSFEPAIVSGLPQADNLPDNVKWTGSNIYFQKKLPHSAESVDISLVASSKPSDYLINIRAQVSGHQPIKAMLPGPAIE